MKLTDSEQAMLDGREGKARQKAMELLVRYAEALGAERFVDTTNVAGVPGSSNPFLQNYYKGSRQLLRRHLFALRSRQRRAGRGAARRSCTAATCRAGSTRTTGSASGASPRRSRSARTAKHDAADRGIRILKTCTPYLAGNVPVRGEHCAWMESSAVVYCNSVLGARTNTEGRESTSAAMLTGKIPDWGLHRDENRFATHRINVEVDVASVMDWGMLGYYVGEVGAGAHSRSQSAASASPT